VPQGRSLPLRRNAREYLARVSPVWRHDNEEPVGVAARSHRSSARLFGFSSGFRLDLAAGDAATQVLKSVQID